MSARNNRISLSTDIAKALRGNTLMTGVALAVLQTQPAHALSLGDLRVQSALGQPLVATTTARIGPGESISSTCIAAPRSNDGLTNPDGIKVTARTGNTPGSYPVQIRTTQPLYEPMYEIRLQIDCPGGVALAKSFVVMLNLPMSVTADSGQTDTPEVAAPARQTQAPATSRPAPRQSTGSTRLSSSKNGIPAGSEYRVRNGDTLSMIAQRVTGRPVGSTWQVTELLYATNPQAFIRGNKDMLKLGTVISIPDAAALSSIAGNAPSDRTAVAANSNRPVSRPRFESNPLTTVDLGRPEEFSGDQDAAPNQTTANPDVSNTEVSNTEVSNTEVSNAQLLREIREQGLTQSDSIASNSPFADEAASVAAPAAVAEAGRSAATPTDSANVAEPVAKSSGNSTLLAIIAGIGMGALLALLMLGRSLIAPLRDSRQGRNAGLRNARDVAAAHEANADPVDNTAPTEQTPAPQRPAYGGAGIDVEVTEADAQSDNAAAIDFNPFTAADEEAAATDADESATPAGNAPRVSLRPAADTGPDNHFDTMLDDLGAAGDDADDNTGTMRNLFSESAQANNDSDDETAEMPVSESPTVEMRADMEPTAELPAVDSEDTASEEVLDVDITDLESLSQHLSGKSSDDKMSATLTQALELLEQDYEEELTQSQILRKKDVSDALSDGKKT